MTAPTRRARFAPGCYHNCGKRAAKGHLFCTKACAAEWAEELAQGNNEYWCPWCAEWRAPHYEAELLQCGHENTGQKRGGDKPDRPQAERDLISAQMESDQTEEDPE